MQLSRIALFALPAIAAATVIPRDSCSTGSTVCCKSVEEAGDASSATNVLAGLLGINLGSITGLIGLTCVPITVLGVGGTSCNSQALCCTDNSFNGLLALGCNNIAL